MKTLTLQAPAKINLFLDVINKREDGYHDIISVMMPISLSDEITVSYDEGDELRVFCNVDVCEEQKNIAYKAAKLFFEVTGKECKRTHITINKKIPHEAGLAGGSTDAAAVLLALNELTGANLAEEELCATGKLLGADVPFCIVKRPMLTEGIGEIFTPVHPLPDCYIVVAKDGDGVSTKDAYAKIDEIGCRVHKDHTLLTDALVAGDLNLIAKCTYNLFEEVVLPVRSKAKEIFGYMNERADITRMSGSGPTILGIFKDREKAQITTEELKEKGINAHLCEPI